MVLSEEKCQLLAPQKQAVRGAETLQVPQSLTTFQCPETLLTSFLILACKHVPHKPVSLYFSSHRRRVWKVPGVSRSRPVHVRCSFLGSATPQDPPTKAGTQRYTPPVCLCPGVFYFLFGCLYQSCTGFTAKCLSTAIV